MVSYRPRQPVRPPRPGGRPIYGRRRRPRWDILLPAGVTLLFVLFLFVRSCGGGGGGPDLTTYVDSVRPYIQRSNEIGTSFRTLPTQGPNLTREELKERLDEMSAKAVTLSDEVLRTVRAVPVEAGAAHGYLLTSFKARAVGLNEIKPPILQANVNPEEPVAIEAFQLALAPLIASDQAYTFFAEDVKAQLTRLRQRSEVPDSPYVRDSDIARPEKQADFVRAIRNSEKLKAAHNLAVAGYETEPPSAGPPEDGVLKLPPATEFELRITIDNKGSLAAERALVKAQLSSSGAPIQNDSDTIEVLPAGEQRVVVLRNLDPARGDFTNRIDIEISIPGVEDIDPTDNDLSFKFQMRK